MVAAIEASFPQHEIERRAYEHQQAVERKERIVVGVNEFVVAEPPPPGLLKVSPALEREQAERMGALRARRDRAVAEGALSALERTARGTGNLMPPILDAVRASCTVGEISDTLRGVFGEHRER
jgi:methylmalonyl-CoA mutase N-terminal domain/subunit